MARTALYATDSPYLVGTSGRTRAQNTAGLQQLIEDALEQHVPAILDFEEAEINDTIHIEPKETSPGDKDWHDYSGLIVSGYGVTSAVGGTTIKWYGPTWEDAPTNTIPSSMFHFVNCRDFQFSNFKLMFPEACGNAFRSTSRNTTGSNPDYKSQLPPTNHSWEKVTLDGVNGGLKTGYYFDHIDGDRNNDHNYWKDCLTLNFGIGSQHSSPWSGMDQHGWFFEQGQSKGNVLDHCQASASHYGDSSKHEKKYGVWGRSFSVVNGGGFDSLQAAILLYRTNDSIFIGGGIQAENCRQLFKCEDTNPYTGVPVVINGARFANNGCEDGDVVVEMPNNGPLVVMGLQIDGSYTVDVVPVKFGCDDVSQGSNFPQCFIAGNLFRGDIDADAWGSFPYTSTNNPSKMAFANRIEEDGGLDSTKCRVFFPVGPWYSA